MCMCNPVFNFKMLLNVPALLVTVTAFLFATQALANGDPSPDPDNAPNLDTKDAHLTVPQILRKYGYPVEVHDITTADGYILQAHRIPYGKLSGASANKPVVWLQ